MTDSSVGRPRVLVVTNDFPPTLGGIQTYVRDYLATLSTQDAHVIVFASTQDAAAAQAFDAQLPYTVVRWPTKVMLPTPATARKMAALIKEHQIDTVWFGAAAPLALLAPAARRAGARRIIASTHGHEVGWSMFPGTRQILRRIGDFVDCLTYVSHYARGRMMAAFGPNVAWEPMPGGVDTSLFRPDPGMREELRGRYGVEKKKVIVAVSRIVSRKGQDTLVEAMPAVLAQHPDAHLMLVGPGKMGIKLERRAQSLGVQGAVTVTGPVDFSELPGHFCMGDVFALPVRTQLGGLSVEGLGIVFLEAQACGVATIAGDGGGAPETVIDGQTGLVVSGREPGQVAARINELLSDANLRNSLAETGRKRVNDAWTWEVLRDQFLAVIHGRGMRPPQVAWNVPA
ncbi:glycosyltransferase family 4 protein [Corynebacterium suicordis]|uniref:Glycosyltransferase family 4 protein n=1 Tax=Corynebacterium suicordis DSM 45110 TaxID=1121369 RepID=A0ABR9ZKN7_9CORY|nr:glycosyltransferase family 4 protein [Corynebacterium suicordis]MBF4553829.1 glycosyltransferase family 4 protein [Corynebacterium suicordis DSM 45110]MDR6277194.1 phosphatidylinositol alpha-1,6-mannosyltransferase [Corynebacterium suicordis]